MTKCDCHHYYLFGGQIRCLHKLFAAGVIKAVIREKTRDGVEFYVYADKPTKIKRGRNAGKWWLDGSRSRLSSRGEVLLAIELSEKYKNNVRRIRI
jgi:hypothetical protein